ncbi:hypothetical protein DRW07_06805 [Alteromonas sediminis]|uniref:Uncharacterized protein n=1 Tax=Alteromonas sediminis TaxID=2259342 RepID=A0A3N5Y0L5_9ALTE|nr:hypothetical protein [Alteromonas sediminis]RPJ67237.1 hypothetical protein DRW07_06805 [Alteromonas sediminis]
MSTHSSSHNTMRVFNWFARYESKDKPLLSDSDNLIPGPQPTNYSSELQIESSVNHIPTEYTYPAP